MSIRELLPPIDLKNKWLNKDRELYTLIFTKTGVGVALNGINVALGDDTLTNASGRSLGVVFSGLLEMANVSASRYFIELSENNTIVGAKSKDGVTDKAEADATKVAYYIFLGILLPMIDYSLNSRFVHLPIPNITPIAQVNNVIVNPLHAGMVRAFLPPQQVIGGANTVLLQQILSSLSIVNNVGGALAVTAGILTTQISGA